MRSILAMNANFRLISENPDCFSFFLDTIMLVDSARRSMKSYMLPFIFSIDMEIIFVSTEAHHGGV